MSPYFETIQLRDGKLLNLGFHQERLQRTRTLELGLKRHPLLEKVIVVPGGLDSGLYTCRVLCGKEIERIEYEPYVRKTIASLKLVYSDNITYGYKYRDRRALEELYQQRGSCSDILIVLNGCISDTSIANVVFWNGEEWLTPNTPLLPGTMRASLILNEEISETMITAEDLNNYKKLKLINAMNDLQSAPELPIESIQIRQ